MKHLHPEYSKMLVKLAGMASSQLITDEIVILSQVLGMRFHNEIKMSAYLFNCIVFFYVIPLFWSFYLYAIDTLSRTQLRN